MNIIFIQGSHFMATTTVGVVRGLPHKILNSKHVLSTAPRVSFYSSSTSSMSEKTSHYAKLPSLPVPKLNQTLEQYIRTVKPLLTKDEFVITEQVAKNFGAPGGVGEKLQHMLEEKGAKEKNWLSEWWLDSAYLSYRLPVLVHSNPALVFPKQSFSSQNEQLTYAAKLIIGALRYKAIIDGAKLEQDYLGKSPLDMSQYTKVFSGCRIPGLTVDSIRHTSGSNHIIVVHNNHFFKMVVYGGDGQMLDDNDILNGLMHIVKNSTGPADGVGFLTTECRNVWGIVNQELKKDPLNSASLQAIEDSIFVMCLDKASKVENDATASSRVALQLLHGYGAENNSGNRWFDKTLQLIVSEDGVNGLCYEHAPTEGPPIANLADFIVNYAKGKTVDNNKGRSTPKSELLTFNLSASVDEAVRLAKRNVDILVQDVQMNSFTFDKFGKEDIKALKFSPDSFIQIAIQMAFIRLHGHPAAHYESASTRRFHGGRTETIRSCLPEIVDFAKVHLKPNQSPQEKYKALQTAITAHKAYVGMAINGQGIDRHLLGLKKLAIENGIDIPTLYLDPGYSTSNNWRLSTSQVAAVNDMVMCYGPVAPDGYGCCYNPRRDGINFAVSAFNSNPTTCANKFGETLKGCLEEIRNIATSSMQKGHVVANLENCRLKKWTTSRSCDQLNKINPIII
ncbi:carnitine O-acetyltransferase-like isoform X1 [Daphnia pulex]|uniref:carnitine O-acetyltransferase-like isoform X1 n=2 Tax=Daphnia pulex TaxID=6669 RepID=UPI001EDE694D|nr:carnitine O-acetyltransferase-like isoform X1 [Daphnia pulex]